jgi:restriction system protein
MAIPTYDQFIEPLLRFLARHPEGARTAAIYEPLADEMKLSESEREELLPCGAQAVYKNRIGWAQDRLKRAGLSASPKRGLWMLTEKGATLVKHTTFPLAKERLSQITFVQPGSTAQPQQSESPPAVPTLESPDDRLNSALFEISESVDVCPPSLASQLWRMIGHELDHPPKPSAKADNRHTKSTSRADLQRVGGTGDAGIDGVISLDRLGLELDHPPKPCAKADKRRRWTNAVGRPTKSIIRRSLRRRPDKRLRLYPRQWSLFKAWNGLCSSTENA